MAVRTLARHEAVIAAIEAIEQQEILAIGLERRQKLVEHEVRLVLVGETAEGLIAVRLEHEHDALRRDRSRSTGAARHHRLQEREPNANPRGAAQQGSP